MEKTQLNFTSNLLDQNKPKSKYWVDLYQRKWSHSKNSQWCVIRFKKEFLNLIIHSCLFFKQCMKSCVKKKIIIPFLLRTWHKNTQYNYLICANARSDHVSWSHLQNVLMEENCKQTPQKVELCHWIWWGKGA